MFVKIMLLFVPIAIIAKVIGLGPQIVFILSFLALVPLSSVLGDATEELAIRTGPKIGGLLNATLGTLTEFIIMFALLRSGQITVLKSAIVGSILISLLLTVGVAVLFGGIKNGTQRFDQKSVGQATTTMILAVVGLTVPTFFSIALHTQNQLPYGTMHEDPQLESISIGVGIILFLLYLFTVLYQLRSPEREVVEAEPVEKSEESKEGWSLRLTLGVLISVTLALAVIGEIMSNTVAPFGKAMGWTDLFMGVVILPFAGAVSEIIVCTRMARGNEVDLAISIPMNGAMQIALFVVPLLVFLSVFSPTPLTLYFKIVEVISVGIAVGLSAYIAIDGVTSWLEGAQFLALWAVLALWFYFLQPLIT